MQKERPNILYIHSHDTGRYVQPYGYAIPTPNIQRLAQEGVLFRKAFCAAPTCSPSRASLLTGQHPHSNGMLGLAHRGFALNDYTQHILHTLRQQAGYHSILIGEEHIAKDFTRIGYDTIVNVKDFHAETLAPTAVSVIRDGLPEPFFLSVGFFETHREFSGQTTQEDVNYTLPPAPLPDTPQARKDMAAFKASATLLDKGIGEIMHALEVKGLAENTLVICTTDHGIPFPLMKGNLTDHGIGVMLIMRGPGGFRGGKVSDALISQVDIFPTLCDLLAIDPPTWLQGRSFLPVVRGEVDTIHDAVFAEITFHAAYEPVRAARTERWKYIRRFDQQAGPVLPNCDDSPSKELLLQNGWQLHSRPVEQLYDLLFDPNEACNLADRLEYAPVLELMRARLINWMQETHDPLLKGAVSAPTGAELNSPDQLSAGSPTHFVSAAATSDVGIR
ncbi:sulfatase family protein [Ktedonosporobacter rubrisoli]|uniref:sulfatase family protein n=1 Tax=Ktedonosporobacter rubrisoli TaxID=2509675 RepID=UPI001F5CCF86|nr:sulfatase [Ktedonosporobacter rubrisoli]